MDFSLFKKTIQDAASQAKKLQADIEQKKQRFEYLQTAPLSREELSAELCKMVDNRAQKYVERLEVALQPQRNQPFFNYASNQHLAVLECNGGGAITKSIPAENLMYLFGDQVKQRLADAVNAMDWPTEVGPDMASRKQEMEKLSKEINSLEGKLSELLSDAAAAGVQISLD